ncbi:glycosyltransferase family 2 protein [Ostreiculturibacter nitratireducens]|uniref:glycosyltransferase family 2 protein n=1 Tax=Ostreiculturibacter nitratireducens TaxID=3075226 RepID=UPI003CCC495A
MSNQPDLHRERYLAPVLTGWLRLKYLLAAGLWMGATLFFWEWWLRPEHNIDGVRYWLITGSIAWVYLMQAFFVLVFLAARRSVAPAPAPGQYRVAMIVTKTPSEPFPVLKRTLEAMLAQDYPHDTWLADEDPTPETIAWCIEHGVKISSRKGLARYHQPVWPRRTRCKEGNLSFFYDHWGYDCYDIVSQLDADHVPQPGYLREILRPFADPKVGYVTAPSICSANAEKSWAARTRLHAEAAFHGVFQAGYTGALAPMCIGSHYAVRTSALRAIGGLGPELAEDHSTSMLMNAGGWRGVHAIDAIAYGDGPSTLADMVTQEFQWSRSLLTIFLTYTPRYLKRLPARLKFLFIFCQLWYPLFAVTTAMMYFVPLVALAFDLRFADVTYPAFVGHALPTVIVLTSFAFLLRSDGFFRPFRAPVIGWEKALFICLQWPWVLWGCLMAVRDRITGRFVDFRITPKGNATSQRLPKRVIGVYVFLAAVCLAPVYFAGDLTEARGFLLLSLFNATIYATIVLVAVVHHLRENGIDWRQQRADVFAQMGAAFVIIALLAGGFVGRGVESLHALAFGLEPLRITRVEYSLSGAGSDLGTTGVHFRFDPRWN